MLDIPPKSASSARKRRRGKEAADRFEAEGIGFHEMLRRAFLDIAAAEPHRCAVIDATKSEEEVAAAVWSAVEIALDPAGARRRRAMRREETEEFPKATRSEERRIPVLRRG